MGEEKSKRTWRDLSWRIWLGVALLVLIGWWGVARLTGGPAPATPPPPQTAVVPSSQTEGQEPVATLKPAEDDRVIGQAFTDAVIGQLEGQLDRFMGWRPNDLVVGRVTDNVTNYQLGVLDVIRRVMLTFNDKLARFGSTYKMNRHLEKALTDVHFAADKFWFPSTESVYRDAVKELKAYRAGLGDSAPVAADGQKAAFFPRSDNLIFLIGQLREVLGSAQNDLTKKREDDGSPVSYFRVDDYFYRAYGILAASLAVMEAVRIDFKEEIRGKSAGPLVDDIVAVLAEPIGLLQESEPLLIIDRPITSIFNNHRAQLNRTVADARQKMASLQATLAK